AYSGDIASRPDPTVLGLLARDQVWARLLPDREGLLQSEFETGRSGTVRPGDPHLAYSESGRGADGSIRAGAGLVRRGMGVRQVVGTAAAVSAGASGFGAV